MRPVWIAALLALPSTYTVAAQDSTFVSAPIILHLPGSTRALALGGAYQVTAADADVIFYNPALLLNGRGIGLSVERYHDAARLVTVSAATDVNFGFGVQVLDYNPPSGDSAGVPAFLGVHGGDEAGEVAGVIAYARTIWKLRLGVAGKWVHHWSADRSQSVAAFDVGTTLNPVNWLTVALGVQNVGGKFEFGTRYDLPTRVALNVATRTKVIGPLDVSLAGHAHKTARRDAAGGIGLEASYWPVPILTFYGRAGARFGRLDSRPYFPLVKESPFTAGGGITFNRVSFDYAWEPFGRATRDAHRIGLRIR